ncbi:hypothetical protein AVEN_221110-1 [Araneus ventricosus]|uniref:Uncharacterized protein n=1 Tax=Araneus ventricosus TaxID=182803 RepID=A0A4Y2T6P8_ARAVE|nr:hypothetical protein AVEN_221110-1 [Araneus ventricosus]
MESHQKPKATPLMVLKVIGLSICMLLGFGASFYAGYNSMPYVLAPIIFLVISCSTCLALISRYLQGRLFLGENLNSIKGSFWLGWVLLCLSVVGSFIFAITGFGKMEGFYYKEYGLYAALVPCLLAVFWSCVLIYDSRYFWRMWQREVGNAMAGAQVVFRP